MTMLISTLQQLRMVELQAQLKKQHPSAKSIEVWWEVGNDFIVHLRHRINY